MDHDETTGQFEQSHGIYAFSDRGEKALTPERHAHLKELKAKVDTEPGRLELRKDLTAAVALIVEMGLSDLKQKAEKGESIWEGGVIKIWGQYANTLGRLLDNWPKGEEKPKNIIDALRGSDE